MLQRRRWERYRKSLDVVIVTAGGASIAGQTQDICEGGLGVVCADTLEVGSDCQFLIADIVPAPFVGTIRWCTASTVSGANLIGVELASMTAEQTEALADCIARWKAQDAGREDA